MPPALKIGDLLPVDPSYAADKIARAFWRLSYRCGRNYASALDALNRPVLVQHEREDPEGFKRRLRITKPRNHCGPIIRKYNDFVFRRPIPRPEDSELYQLMVEDADGRGTPLQVFIRRSLLMAQKERESYLVPDSTAPADGKERSVAQAKEAGIRPILRRLPPDSVVWWRDRDGTLVECIVLFRDDAGAPYAIHYDARATTRIVLKDADASDKRGEYQVVSVGPEVAHAAKACPVVRMRPEFDDDQDGAGESQISPLAELQQSIFNKSALLDEELYNITFSQSVLSGVSAEAVKKANIGNNRLICLPNPAAKLDRIGADPDQAASIRQSIEDEQRELYRIAGVQTADPLDTKGQAESGIAKAFKFNDLAANLSALADAAEDAENAVMLRLFRMNGQPDPQPAEYPDKFELPDLAEELEVLIRVLTVAQVPKVIKRQIAETFAGRNLNLDDAETAAMLEEMDQTDDQSATENPLPGGKNKPAPTDVGA